MGARVLAAVDCLDALASHRQYQNAVSLDAAMEKVASMSGSAFEPRIVEVLKRRYPDLEMMARTLDGPIQDALQALPEEFRIVVILADIEELSYEDISKTLGCPIGTVRSRLHRGRRMLRTMLSESAA